jgi:hypothetical protein
METLDPSGKLLYESYIKARDNWISYIRPRAIKKFDDYLSSVGRIYYKYEYYTDTSHGFLKDNSSRLDKEKSTDMIAKYKKLCILFHPDKYKHSSSADLFCLLKKWFDTGNANMLDILDRISHLILEIPITDDSQSYNLTNLLTNLDNRNIMGIIKSNCSNIEDSRCLFDLLNTDPAKLDISSSGSTCQNTNQSRNEDFMKTHAYEFFINEEQQKTVVKDVVLTETELIEFIKENGKYNNAFLDFYMERYSENKNIIQAILELKNEKEK